MRLFLPLEVNAKVLYNVLTMLFVGFILILAVYYGLTTIDAESVQKSTDFQNHTFVAENVSHQTADIQVDFFGYEAKIKIIFPGTKWCGASSIAKNPQDLGINKKVDKCCRKHDFCPSYLLRKETKFGLNNKDWIVKSHCDCDEQFYYCLKNSNDIMGNFIGRVYFNALRMKCFKKEYKVVKCTLRKRGRCLEYKVDKHSERVYQWFDNPKF